MIPCEYWEFTVKEPPEVLAARLRANVQDGWLLRRRERLFVGRVDGHRFEITPGSDPTREPIVDGTFEPAAGGTLVRIKFRMRNWILFAPLTVFAVLSAVLFNAMPILWGAGTRFGWWLPAGILAAGMIGLLAARWDFYVRVPHLKQLFAQACRLSPSEDIDLE